MHLEAIKKRNLEAIKKRKSPNPVRMLTTESSLEDPLQLLKSMIETLNPEDDEHDLLQIEENKKTVQHKRQERLDQLRTDILGLEQQVEDLKNEPRPYLTDLSGLLGEKNQLISVNDQLQLNKQQLEQRIQSLEQKMESIQLQEKKDQDSSLDADL